MIVRDQYVYEYELDRILTYSRFNGNNQVAVTSDSFLFYFLISTSLSTPENAKDTNDFLFFRFWICRILKVNKKK